MMHPKRTNDYDVIDPRKDNNNIFQGILPCYTTFVGLLVSHPAHEPPVEWPHLGVGVGADIEAVF